MTEIVYDDFVGGDGSDGSIGTLGWRTGAGTITPGSGSTDHMGVLGLTTGATSGDTARIHLGRTVSTPIADLGQVLRWSATLALAQTSNTLVRVGWGTDISSATFGTDGIWWSWSSADGSTWKLNCRSGGTTTTIDSGVTSATDYVTLACYRQGSRWIGIVRKADGTETTVPSTANEPASGTALNLGVYVETLANASKTIGLDSVGFRHCRARGARSYL